MSARMGAAAALFALSLLSQVPPVLLPCAPGDSTVTCKCKQGSPSACAELAKVNPETLKGLLRLAAMAQAAQEAGKAKEAEKGEAQAVDGTGCGNGEDPNEKQECTGQWHHVVSRAVWQALEIHKVLRGKYTYRDRRFVAQAKDLKAHCGYQDWHRELDARIRAWLEDHSKASAEEFEAYLRDLYAQPELRARFPNGF